VLPRTVYNMDAPMTTNSAHTLKFKLNDDHSGCSYTLFENGKYITEYLITYGWNTPEWQEQEVRERTAMNDDLIKKGLQHLLDQNLFHILQNHLVTGAPQ